MARNWYLLRPPYDQLSGFEDDALNEFAQDGFAEALDTGIAENVELYNYDLSICKPMRAIIQNKLQDTKLKTLSREMLVPIGTCKAGMYVKYKERFWLIVGLVDNNIMYEKAILTLCNYLLTWLNSDKKIIQRWASASSASQYNNGETGNQFFTVRSDQLLILMPDDEESLMLDSGTRFIIDRRCQVYEKRFAPDVLCDTSKPVSVYKLTRSDSVLYNYQDSGHYEFMAYQDEQHKEDGYYVIDGKGYWLCGKPAEEDNKTTLLSSTIDYDSLEIFNNLDPGVFTAIFCDADGNEVNVKPKWGIYCDFVDKLNVDYINNSIYISVNDKNLINKSFDLFLSAEGYDTVGVTVTIRAFI